MFGGASADVNEQAISKSTIDHFLINRHTRPERGLAESPPGR
jgi:hypothetical protein